GEGDNRHRLERMAQEAGVADSVNFTGFVSDEELGRLYQSASVFALPSQQEGFGIVYAEAMWHGLPCVGSTADAAVDVVVDGETGLLIPYGDVPATAEALIRILDDADWARTLGANGRAVCIDRYMPDTFSQRLRSTLAESVR
ncbi:MAG: glycosyltransferase family 4 protein, partial [Actinomycetia bacterium]|nr:glycosyltransferase family 4 protein [Actinomycetes bacterium]